jgi:hypothetical protein
MMTTDCIAPHEIKEGDLVAYLEGAASKAVNDHISRCHFCQAEVKELKQLDDLIKLAPCLDGRKPRL